MNKEAQALADFWGEHNSETANMMCYLDGAVLWLTVTPETQARVRKRIEKWGAWVLGSARASNGFGGVLIIRTDDWDTASPENPCVKAALQLAWMYLPRLTLQVLKVISIVEKVVGPVAVKDNTNLDMNTIEAIASALMQFPPLTTS